MIDRILGEDEEDDHHDASEEEEEISPGIEESASQISREDAMKLVFSDNLQQSGKNRMDSDLSSQASVMSFKSSALDEVPKKTTVRARRSSYLSRHSNSPHIDRRKSSEMSKDRKRSMLQLQREHKRKIAVSTYKILSDAIESLSLNAPKPNETQSHDVVDEILSQLEIIARLGESVSGTLHLGSIMPVRYIMRALQRYFLHREAPVRNSFHDICLYTIFLKITQSHRYVML